MAEAVADAMTDRTHLLVQAGTGTGKSLGYLVPALLHEDRVVVATATLALQHQLVERDLPALIQASQDVLARTPSYSVLKGRGNYACLHRIREGVPDDQGALVELPQGSLGSEVLELRSWAEEEAERRGHGRPRLGAAAHRPGLAPGLGLAPRVPRRRALPLRDRVLRRGGPRGGVAGRRRGDQPLDAGHRRHRGCPDDPGVRRGRRRRGPRADRARDPGLDPGAHADAGGARHPARRAPRQRDRGRRPRRRGRGAARRDRLLRARADRHDARRPRRRPRADPRRGPRPGLRLRQGHRRRRRRRRRPRRGCRRCS